MKPDKILKELKTRLKQQLEIQEGFLGVSTATGAKIDIVRDEGSCNTLQWVLDQFKELEDDK